MPPTSNLPTGIRTLLRRAAALGLFALQAMVALSPVAEHRGAERLQSHVEETGSSHPWAHDEAACPLCAVRSMHATVPDKPAPHVDGGPPAQLVMRAALAAPAAPVPSANHSRAPPTPG